MAQFSWAATADVGLGLANAFASWGASSANRIVANANAEAQNRVRKAQNEQRATGLSLAATVRSLSDRAALVNAGEASNNAAVLMARTQESWVRGDVEQGLRDMEQLGAFNARAAAAGVGGASVQAVSYSVRLAQARLSERHAEQRGEVTYEMLKQRTGIMPAAVSRLDISPLNPNIDYTTNSAQASTGNGLFGALAEGLLSKNKSLQVALDSMGREDTTQLATGDFARMDRGYTPAPLTEQRPFFTDGYIPSITLN